FGGGSAGSPNDAFVARLSAGGSTPLTYTAPAGTGPHNLVLRRSGANVELLDNDVLVRSQPLGSTDALRITRAANAPGTLTIDHSGGVFGVTGGLRFDGGAGGGNEVVLLGSAAADTFSLTPGVVTCNTVQVLTLVNVQGATARGGANDSAYLYGGPSGET